jgi:hypothetical protein
MALEFEDIAERASMSGASTARIHTTAAKEGDDTVHSLSRSKKMALEFEEIAERAALGAAADLAEK